MKIKTIKILPEFDTNTYLMWDEESKEAMIIDPAKADDRLLNEIKDLKLKYIVNTHGHGDHIGGNALLKEKTDAKIAIHKHDAKMLQDPNSNLSSFWGAALRSPAADILLQDGDELKLGKYKIKIIHTPGHSEGGICLLIGNAIFSGDTLFASSIGRTDLPGGSYNTLINSIKTKILTLSGNTIVYPGHGPETTVEDESVSNPFVGFADGI
ncbi:MAG: MBL fold metallo-hydrolase [Candidatus Cloacimonetes bacterium]|nr:MBL fold metallo-hydrolase [Candidatus Cloacimonadota bacterium]MCF7815121.1 MBL fold metallo-hydrolase [Candidatus Cloacimonadota bacterium]MCF7869362.1 MBL fold metallo-hydrolase [Candidatus Cloacimonadota bacterium]MCF7884757.1 MBL fold metallo-hydrolase [Candidatus Cloacimonadota bacterium]